LLAATTQETATRPPTGDAAQAQTHVSGGAGADSVRRVRRRTRHQGRRQQERRVHLRARHFRSNLLDSGFAPPAHYRPSKTLFGGIVFENSRCAGILFDCLHKIYACKIYMGLSLFTVNLQ
jgi:hypothetical protein